MSTPIEDIRNNRIKKLERFRAQNIDPYPEQCSFALTQIVDIQKLLSKYIKAKRSIGIGGRVMAKREHGKSVFVDIFDGSGKFQLFVAEDRAGEEQFKQFVDLI